MNKEDSSEEGIRENCSFCDKKSSAYHNYLGESDNFTIVCDANPLTGGHILLIPKQHISCIGEYPADIFDEFMALCIDISNFIIETYGSVATFEHGITGQTIFHSHIHFLPFSGNYIKIIPEGNEYIQPIDNILDLKEVFKKDKEYLFFSIGDNKWIVNTSIAESRFFRDRFAIALGNNERADWKVFQSNKILKEKGNKENEKCKNKWREYKSS